jgi:hypothetical protein
MFSVCICLFCACVVLCLGRGLATSWSLVQGILPSEKWSWNWKVEARALESCRASEKSESNVQFSLPLIKQCHEDAWEVVVLLHHFWLRYKMEVRPLHRRERPPDIHCIGSWGRPEPAWMLWRIFCRYGSSRKSLCFCDASTYVLTASESELLDVQAVRGQQRGAEDSGVGFATLRIQWDCVKQSNYPNRGEIATPGCFSWS